jgi:adenosylmethionine---8-amino-7-oxononanoate aminotransferase
VSDDVTDAFDLVSVDHAHVWHPYTQHALAGPARGIARASGAYLYDERENAIFDAISSWWVTLHGHAHPTIARAIARQADILEQVIFAGFAHEPASRLAADLIRIAPGGMSRVFFTDDGSTAVEVAIKMALQFWRNAGENRPLIVALEHAYHGDTFGAMSVSARGVFTAPFDNKLFEVIRLPDPATHDVSAAFAELLGQRAKDIAAIIVEPMLQGAGGMRMGSADDLRSLHALAVSNNVLFIADEVLTGFGRTGPMFACEYASIVPDLMCLSKGITGGFLPLGATLATERIFQQFHSGDSAATLFHGHSYTANPLACAAAVASLELLDEHSAQKRAAIERSHRAAAVRFASHARVRNARVLGTVFAFEIDDGVDYLNPVSRALHRFALDRGVLLRPLGNTVYLLPPYCSTESDLGHAYSVIAEFLESR